MTIAFSFIVNSQELPDVIRSFENYTETLHHIAALVHGFGGPL